MLTIYTNGKISLDGRDVHLSVRQGPYGTEVYTPEEPRYDDAGRYVGTRKFAEHKMPYKRYCLSREDGSRHAPGLRQFEADLRVLAGSLSN